MAVGLSLPGIPNKRGGLALSTGDASVVKILAIALGDNDSDNPFQEFESIGDLIFDPADETTFSKVRDIVKNLFSELRVQEIADLQRRPDNLAVVQIEPDKYQMNIYWINLETGVAGESTATGDVTGITVR